MEDNLINKSLDKPKKILLIDDELDMLTVNSALLESHGYEVFLAKTGFEALEIVNRNHPDLIILDLMIPGIDGYQICGMLKRDKRYLSIPVVILSARFSEQDKKMAKEIGANDYITKPFEPKTLLSKISSLLDNSRNGQKTLIGQSKLL
jgi:two-component system alkaline phosphatase synthesis response regulator PhoP